MRLACLVLLGAARVASQSCASTHAHDSDTLECEEWCDTTNLAKHCSFCKCGGVRHVPPAGATAAAAAASAAARAGLARSVRAVSVATAAVEPVPVAAAAVGAVPVAPRVRRTPKPALATAAAGARFVAAVASFDAELRY